MSDATKQLDDLRRQLRDTRTTLNQVLKEAGRYRTALEQIACDPVPEAGWRIAKDTLGPQPQC